MTTNPKTLCGYFDAFTRTDMRKGFLVDEKSTKKLYIFLFYFACTQVCSHANLNADCTNNLAL